MRAVVQRVRSASVTVDGEPVGAIEAGLLVLLGIAVGDRDEDVETMARKIVGLRIFADEDGRFDRSVLDAGGAVLVVSQFTLLADTRRGRRPSFVAAASPEIAAPRCEELVVRLRNAGCVVATGRFGANMQVTLVNDGPVTIVLDVPSPEQN